MFKTKFDNVISCGADCACAMYLRKCSLRDSSGPFDWIAFTSFDVYIRLLTQRFSGFCEYENMKRKDLAEGVRVDPKNDGYLDLNTDFYFAHDFRAGIPLEETFPAVKEKYNRRIARMYRNIEEKRNTLFVWWSKDKKIDAETLLNAQTCLSEYFKKPIWLLIFENDRQTVPLAEQQISEYVIKYRGALDDAAKSTMGNIENSLPVFKSIRKRHFFLHRTVAAFRRIFARVLACFIPVSAWRKWIRKNIGKIGE